jgi:hypothetical protein
MATDSRFSSGWNNADQVAFRVLEPRRLASPGIAATPFPVRVSGVSYSSNPTPRPLISSTAARVGHVDDGLRELP